MRQDVPGIRAHRSHRLAIALTVLALAAALLPSTACQRRTRFVPVSADSTAGGPDSTLVRIREAQSSWEAGAEPQDAARLTARAFAEDLRDRPPDEWASRADALLDSLAIGAEIARGPCALVLNFFPRSDPGAGSWPYLFTCGEKGLVWQSIEGKGLRLLAVATRNLAPNQKPSQGNVPGTAVLFARRGAGGPQPLLMVWNAAGARWKLVQTLGPDSLGGAGTGEFETPDEASVELVTRTYRTPPSFEECATCPHLYVVGRFRWEPDGFERVDWRAVPSPYSTFVRFIRALTTDDQLTALSLTTDPGVLDDARHNEWDRVKGIWRIAPGTEESPQRMTFFRGQQEAYRVQFEKSGSEWMIAGFEPVPRMVE